MIIKILKMEMTKALMRGCMVLKFDLFLTLRTTQGLVDNKKTKDQMC